MKQIKKKIIIRHSFVQSTISNDSNTQYSYNVFNLIGKITEYLISWAYVFYFRKTF